MPRRRAAGAPARARRRRARPEGARVGLPREYFPADLDAGVRAGARPRHRSRAGAGRRRCARCRCRTRSTRCRPTTSWRPPRRRRTWPGSTACDTGRARPAGTATDVAALSRHPRRGLRPRGAPPHPGRHLRAERRLLRRLLRQGTGRCARCIAEDFQQGLRERASTSCSRRPRRRPRSGRARRPATRCRCTRRHLRLRGQPGRPAGHEPPRRPHARACRSARQLIAPDVRGGSGCSPPRRRSSGSSSATEEVR